MKQTKTWRFLAAATVSAPLLVACGGGDNAINDSAGGTVAMTDSTGMSTTGTTSDNAAGAMDGGMASFALVVNQAEVEAGQLATTKARNAEVKAYARELVETHQKALQEMQELSSRSGWAMPDASTAGNTGAASGGTGMTNPGTTGGTTADPTQGGSMSGAGSAAQTGGSGMMASTITQLQQSHQTAITQLRQASGAAFDRAFIDSQVTAHQQVLDVLRQHATSIQNSDLRSKLTDMQGHVEAHLKQAQEIAQKIGSGTGN